MVKKNKIPNFIDGREVFSKNPGFFKKINPHDGEVLSAVTQSMAPDVFRAVASCVNAQKKWASVPPVRRGKILYDWAAHLERDKKNIAGIAARETGKSFKHAAQEADAAIALARFFAAEGQRLYGRTTTSGMEGRRCMTVRQPVGVVGLIVAANTPIANIAWKIFPALICGNAAVLKASEDAPGTALAIARSSAGIGLIPGVLNVIQGTGKDAGEPLVRHAEVGLVSFTGSTAVGRKIGQMCANRLAKVSLELGGKNALVICEDADLEKAVRWAILSSFGNAGQRCSASSRILVMEKVYVEFRERMVRAARELQLGTGDADDLGPVIHRKQMEKILDAVRKAKKAGARILTGGQKSSSREHRNGCYVLPTILEGLPPKHAVSREEIFGPMTVLYRVKNFSDAVRLANDSVYGLTAAIHTRSLDRAFAFADEAEAGVVTINGGTYGSEAHMPFGGLKQSGNGTREPGTEALDVYSQIKNINIQTSPMDGL